ncbi:MAG: response regulator [Pseudomonadota bacterium]
MNSSEQALVTFTGLVNAAFLRLGRLFAGTTTFVRQNAPAAAPLDNPFPGRPRVLVADDHPENRLIVEALLYRWRIKPVQAADGAEAVALACGQHFDLILMDLQMPVLDGLTATLQIRRFEHGHGHPRAPIVAYTSSTLGDDWPILRACGFDESLEKPCGLESLATCLQRWCGNGPRQAHLY